MITQITFQLPLFERGYHLITDDLLSNIGSLPKIGLLNIFIKHTSAGITINENADPSVRVDFETLVNRIVPESQSGLIHTYEGPDDMPAHIKSSIIGSSISIPICNGRLDLGVWQGIYLCEFRNHSSSREVTCSIIS